MAKKQPKLDQPKKTKESDLKKRSGKSEQSGSSLGPGPGRPPITKKGNKTK